MFEAVDALVEEHQAIERRLAEPDVFSDPDLSRRLNQRYAALTAVVKTYAEWRSALGDVTAARELATEDDTFVAEAERLDAHRLELEERLRRLLRAARRGGQQGRDPGDQGGRGRRGVGPVRRRPDAHVHPLRRAPRLEDRAARRDRSDLGGVKSATVAVKAKGVSEPGEAPYALLKFEGGCTACNVSPSPSRRAESTRPPPVCW